MQTNVGFGMGNMRVDFQSEIKSITNQIIEKYNPEKIILFGSAARGQFSLDSDADFLIIKKNTPYYGADRIRELSRLIERNIPIDLLVYKPEEFKKRIEMGDPFLKAILKEGKILYG
jgi:predicted nucleotidyltransferase